MRRSNLTTATQLLAMGDKSSGLELVRGELRTMSPASHWHGAARGRLVSALGAFVLRRRLGEVLAAEPGFLLATDPDTVLAPDVAFVRAERIPGALRDGWFPGPPDIAVEVLSPSDRMPAVRSKVRCWLAHGTRSVWVVNQKRHSVTVHSAGRGAVEFPAGDVLRDPVLPGFRVRVDSLFPPGD